MGIDAFDLAKKSRKDSEITEKLENKAKHS